MRPRVKLAATTLALGLERLHLGGVITNRDFLVNALRSDVFLRGEATTDFVENSGVPRGLEASDDEARDGGSRGSSVAAGTASEGRPGARPTYRAGGATPDSHANTSNLVTTSAPLTSPTFAVATGHSISAS